MDTYSNIESLFSDYFADGVGPAMRYASLRESDMANRETETQAMEMQTAPAHNRVMAMEENDGNKD